MGVFLLIITDINPPITSVPKDKGHTSTKTKLSKLSSCPSLFKAASIAAPYATASSAFIVFNIFFLFSKNSEIKFWICGILVEPPIRTTSVISFLVKPDSLIVFFNASIHWLNNDLHILLISIWVRSNTKSSSCVKELISIWESTDIDNSFFASSQAIFNLLKAFWLFEISISVSF